MRLLLVLLAACGASARVPADPPPAIVATPTPAATPVAPEPARDLDQPTVISRSKQFFDAIDNLDLHAVQDAMSSTFVWFEDARFMDKAGVGKWLQGRIDRHVAPRTRTWDDEHVYITAGSAVFVAHAVEHVPAEADRPAVDQDGYNTVVWVRTGERWEITLWEWTRAGLAAERDRWNEAFRIGVGFNHKPNQLLVDTLKGRKPGRALDLLMGQGRNAIYIASQGWKVTGVDISDEGIRIAKETAASQKLQLETIEADVEKWDLGKDRWDLVTMIYAGDDAKLVERVKPSLKKGGLFVLEYFHAESEAAKSGAGGWKTGALAALFKDGYKILRDDVVDDTADYSLRTQKLVRFVAQKL